jgi:hypothetical protein
MLDFELGAGYSQSVIDLYDYWVNSAERYGEQLQANHQRALVLSSFSACSTQGNEWKSIADRPTIVHFRAFSDRCSAYHIVFEDVT